jgi:hypothetical protein
LRQVVQNALGIVDRLFEHANPLVSTHRFGDLALRIRVLAERRTRGLLRMIEHRCESTVSPSATIDVLDGPYEELEPLLPPRESRGHRLVISDEDTFYYWLPEHAGSLSAIDRKARRGIVWHLSGDEISSWEFSRPFLYPIHAFLMSSPWMPVHAAAIARGASGLLVVGPAGVGKTTIALACAEAGWSYVGDDFVLVQGQPPRACNLYRSARMREDTFARVPKAMSAVTGMSTDDGELRAEVDVGLVTQVTSDVEVRAIVVPQRRGAENATIVAMRRSQALLALAGSTLALLPGNRAEAYEKLAILTRNVPCCGFDPGHRLSDTPSVLARLL